MDLIIIQLLKGIYKIHNGNCSDRYQRRYVVESVPNWGKVNYGGCD